MIDVLAVGEILIDFTENGLSGQSNKVFEANPGGAPANVLAALNKHGKKGALVAKVGNDGFGRILLSALNEAGVDSSFVAVDDSSLTTLAFVQTFDGGEREFSFYRDRTADVMLNRSDIPLDAVKDSRIIHFGSVSLSSDPARDSVHYMIEEAFKDGKFISFDPNYRPFLWHDEAEAKREVFRFSDFGEKADEPGGPAVFGMLVLVPFIRETTGSKGNVMLTACILLGIMILPTIIGTTESALRSVTRTYYEGALALGATKERTIFTVMLPAAKSGVLTGVVLGIGRAIGETMAVIMIAGNQVGMPEGLLKGVRTLTANIVLEMGYATGLHREALIATAVVLFVFILIINLSVSLLRRGQNAGD